MINTDVALADKTIIVDELVPAEGVYGHYELARIRKSPDNRKRFNEANLQELAASIKAMGVAQPILIRPVTPTAEAPEDFEIVAGERRYRASIIAGMATIPALLRVLSDLDAAKIRILENLQREDPHPMEEAEGYQLLMLQHGFDADQLADEVKKSRSYIYGRLKLCALTSEVREQFLDNVIPASTALLIARIPVPKLQVKALGEIVKPNSWSTEPMSYRAAAAHVQNRYMLDLSTATFRLADAKLLASAGACTKCPKRAGNQPEVFEGVGANVCTDPDCFAEKRAAHHAATVDKANKNGIPVLEGSEGTNAIQRCYSRSSEYVLPGSHISYFDRNSPSTGNQGHAGKYLADDMLPPVAAYAMNSQGEPVAIYKREDMQMALEAAGACETVEAHAERMRAIEADPSKAPPKPEWQVRQEQQEQDRRAAQAVADQESIYRLSLYKQLRQRASVTGLSLPSLREYAKAVLIENDLNPSLHDLYESDVSSDLDTYIDNADAAALQLLLIDAVLGSMLEVSWHDIDIKQGNVDDDGFSTVVAMARHEGIDPDQVREELFPTPINVDGMQYDDLVKFIQAHPGRINELKEKIIEGRPDLVSALDQAALPDFVHDVGGFRPMQPNDILGFIQKAPDRVNELATAIINRGTGEQADAFSAATSQLGYWRSEGLYMPPSVQSFAQSTPAETQQDALGTEELDDLADQVPADAVAAQARQQSKAKSERAKPGAKASTGKAAAKPSASVAEKKPAKATNSAPKASGAVKPADAWPFPKTSTGKREPSVSEVSKPQAQEAA
jgi:ParB/RepB/Spo0J family partition protein